MRSRLSWFAAALVSFGALAVFAPACGGDGKDPNADNDKDGYLAKDDCDDDDASIHPGATEPCSCDGKDDDCNGKVDDFACALNCYPANDSDGDGYVPPEDCNDQDPTIHPGATEPCVCDSIDQDCSDDPQDFVGCDNLVCHQDKDGDGFDDAVDCNDNDGGINPNAGEKCECDDVDQNCNGSKTDLPDGCDKTCTDADGDGYFAEGGDCDDGDKDIHPGAMEPCVCDAIDQDCSGDPQDFLCDLACLDIDNDGAPQGVDCDDNDPAATPGSGPEPCACDGIDNDCNGTVDDFDASCMKTCTYLANGDMCTDGMEPACGAGLACCQGGAGGPATCTMECQGDQCSGKCPLVP